LQRFREDRETRLEFFRQTPLPRGTCYR
jgi:hypothetical protein